MVCFSENVIKEDFFKGGEDALEISEMVFVMCAFVNIKFDGFGGKSRMHYKFATIKARDWLGDK